MSFIQAHSPSQNTSLHVDVLNVANDALLLQVQCPKMQGKLLNSCTHLHLPFLTCSHNLSHHGALGNLCRLTGEAIQVEPYFSSSMGPMHTEILGSSFNSSVGNQFPSSILLPPFLDHLYTSSTFANHLP